VVVVLLFSIIATFLLMRTLPMVWPCGRQGYATSLREATDAAPVPVQEVTSMREVTQGDEKLVILMFYADWCVHCKRFKDDFNKIAQSLHGSHAGKVKVAQIEQARTSGDDLRTMKVEGFPTVLAILKDSNGEIQTTKELERMEPAEFLAADAHKTLWESL
tara:strand:- start:3642 stop:4124 length:483 start_codon:yes stop_codon:yes gene_type:complete